MAFFDKQVRQNVLMGKLENWGWGEFPSKRCLDWALLNQEATAAFALKVTGALFNRANSIAPMTVTRYDPGDGHFGPFRW